MGRAFRHQDSLSVAVQGPAAAKAFTVAAILLTLERYAMAVFAYLMDSALMQPEQAISPLASIRGIPRGRTVIDAGKAMAVVWGGIYIALRLTRSAI